VELDSKLGVEEGRKVLGSGLIRFGVFCSGQRSRKDNRKAKKRKKERKKKWTFFFVQKLELLHNMKQEEGEFQTHFLKEIPSFL